ncbi:MAG: SDR family oxidoreductase, partial [Xanthobacteraceae bacterium]
ERTFGRCDILVNNAGIFQLQPFEQISFADWRRVLSINLDSAFLTAQAFAPGMKRRGWGRIVNMASSTFGTVTLGYVHYIANAAARQAIPRPMLPADLVGTLSFLTSDDAAFVTRQTLYVNGGLVRV